MLDQEDREFLDVFMGMSEEERTELTESMDVYELLYLSQMLILRAEELLEHRVSDSDLGEAREVCREIFGSYPKN